MIKTLVFLIAVFFAGPAFSCPILEHANPRVGSETSGKIDKVELEFSSRVYPGKSTVTVTNAAGRQLNIGKAYGKWGSENSVATKVAALAPGKYTVTWDVYCDCGHLTPGDYSFSIR